MGHQPVAESQFRSLVFLNLGTASQGRRRRGTLKKKKPKKGGNNVTRKAITTDVDGWHCHKEQEGSGTMILRSIGVRNELPFGDILGVKAIRKGFKEYV